MQKVLQINRLSWVTYKEAKNVLRLVYLVIFYDYQLQFAFHLALHRFYSSNYYFNQSTIVQLVAAVCLDIEACGTQHASIFIVGSI